MTGQTIAALGRALAAREVTAERVTDECLQAIAGQNTSLNAFIRVMADEARAQARQADAEIAAGKDRGPLHGVPISLKDLIDVRGVATTAAGFRRFAPCSRDWRVPRRRCARPTGTPTPRDRAARGCDGSDHRGARAGACRP